MFSEKDIKQMDAKGISILMIEKQLECFRKGFPKMKLTAPAIAGNGIRVFSADETAAFISVYDEALKGKSIMKFVPASGAATRMFKTLYAFREKFRKTDTDIENFVADRSEGSVYTFFQKIRDFAFYNDLNTVMEINGISLQKCIEDFDLNTIISFVLDEDGLNYGSLPKALIKFHDYEAGARTAAEEHLVEGAGYARDENKEVRIHFTISPEHTEAFHHHLDHVKAKYEDAFGVKYIISHSVQNPSTDTIAVGENNEIFRERDGDLFFRPGGHGALLGNLNMLEADVVIIKNIDNIVTDRLKEKTFIYKKVIVSYLLELQKEIFNYLMILDEGNATEDVLEKIAAYCTQTLNIRLPLDFEKMDKMEMTDLLYNKLNRPIRVCGMVKNEGDTGGGPFWVKDSDSEISLQIVETSQIDLADPGQDAIFRAATHFNPVDIACSLKDFNGRCFNLKDFVDDNAGFISIKSKDGKVLKALELPGLWNGSMSDWISVFVEVPLITFNPVKEVNDLLKPEHQP